MERQFGGREEDETPAEINLCIFPHLKQVVVLDLRGGSPQVHSIDASRLFDDTFFKRLEESFSELLREETDHPFWHLMVLPTRMEELVREAVLLAILEQITPDIPEEDFPRVAVLMVSGSALALSDTQVNSALSSLFGDSAAPEAVSQCMEVVKAMMAREKEEMKRLEREEMKEALTEQSQRFFTLWENRN